MQYFIDFEFLEDGKTIEPISFGMVSQDGRGLYLQFIQDTDFHNRLTPWLRENVIPHLVTEGPWVTREQAAKAILDFIGDDKSVCFWGYYADYDWVVLCWLYGTMMQLPDGWPMYCRDIKQLCDALGNPKLPEQGEGEHHALADARWNKTAYEFLVSHTPEVAAPDAEAIGALARLFAENWRQIPYVLLYPDFLDEHSMLTPTANAALALARRQGGGE